MATARQLTLSWDAYLKHERAAETKSELVDGYTVAMAGASRAHNLITANLARILGNHLLGGPCELYTNDMRVRVAATGLHAYPDAVLVCDAPQFVDDAFDTLLNPVVLIEVLSPTTAAFDRGRKFQDYRQIPTLQHYLLIEQQQRHIECYTRRPDATWVLTEASGAAASIAIPALQCALPLADVYRKVEF